MKYSAIDLHSNNNVLVVTGEADCVLFEKRLPNDLTRVLESLTPHRDQLQGVVVESTYNWYWLVDGLMAAGYNVLLANTSAVKVYEGLKHGNDESDARHLAHLFRLGILPTGYICPPAERAVRDLARRRIQLVRNRTTHILSVENQLARQTGRHIRSNDVKRLDADGIAEFKLPDDVATGMSANVAVIQTLNSRPCKIHFIK